MSLLICKDAIVDHRNDFMCFMTMKHLSFEATDAGEVKNICNATAMFGKTLVNFKVNILPNIFFGDTTLGQKKHDLGISPETAKLFQPNHFC